MKKEYNMNYPITTKDALDLFEKGEPITVVELGGIGPNYETYICTQYEKIQK